MKKNYLIMSLLYLVFLLPLSAQAELKIGFVNALKVMDVAPQVEQANSRLEREFAPRQQNILNAQKQVRDLEDRLAKNAAIMTESESLKLGRDIRDKKRDIKRQQEEFREDYNIRRSEELDKLQKRIVEVIQAIAKEEAYDVILSDGGVVWASTRVDITDKVLKRLGQQAGSR